MGEGTGSGSSGWWLAFTGLVLGSSVAIGSGRLGAGIPAAAAAPVVPGSSAANGTALTPPARRRAKDHCIERFLAPLEEAGVLTVPAASEPAPTLRLTPSLTSAGLNLLAETGDDPGAAASLPEQLAPLVASSGRPEVIVATVADPIDSGLSYKFDAALQAIRLGAEQSIEGDDAYHRDRSWLPWDDRSVAPEKRALSEGCRHSTPGVLLFRSSATRGFLLVLLVGETPLRGLHPRAMVLALELAALLNEAPQPPLNIVGPMFSGSAPSLWRALDDWSRTESAASVSHVRIQSGAATGSEIPQLLDSRYNRALPAGKRVEFVATIAPEDSLRCAYLNFLHRRLGVAGEVTNAFTPPSAPPWSLPEVAFLYETGTEFGAASGRGDRRCPVAGVELSFPVHVSLLRDAYEEMDKQTPPATEASIARRTSLGISLREPRRPVDLPEASTKSVYAQDLALSNLLDVIARRNIRHVGIQATDIGDAMFLARKIRDITPDVRIAFLTSDVLLGHGSYERDLDGSLVVSSYPFLGAGSLGQRAERTTRHSAFENASALGIFNAMLVARDAPVSALRDYVFGASDERLPVWISAMTGGRLSPISATPSRTTTPSLFESTPHPDPRACPIEAQSGDDEDDLRRRRLQMCKLGISARRGRHGVGDRSVPPGLRRVVRLLPEPGQLAAGSGAGVSCHRDADPASTSFESKPSGNPRRSGA